MSFSEWMARGFVDVIPVVPPGATLSSYAKIRPEDRGKAPGRRTDTGDWTGLPSWATIAADASWDAWGANIGLRTRYFPAVDIDIEDAALANQVRDLAHHVLGPAPVRSRSNTGKLALLYRTDVPFRRMRLWLRKENTRALIEILGDGQQFVVEGMHASGVPIVWSAPVPASELTGIRSDLAEQFLLKAESLLSLMGYMVTREGGGLADRRDVNQDAHRGDLALLRQAIAALPNTSELFPGRVDYLKVGIALKAALPDHPQEAFELWWSWCEKWDGGSNSREVAERDWAGMHPPFTLGASWIFEIARPHGFSDAPSAFPPIPNLPPPPSVTSVTLPAPQGVSPTAALFSDAWLANQFRDQYGSQVRFCPQMGGWLRWDGTRWAPDTVQWVVETAGSVARSAGIGASDADRRRLGSERIRHAIAAYAATAPEIALPPEAFDSDPWSLNTPAGILDLRTGQLSLPRPDRLFTRCTAVGPLADPAPKWRQFLEEATEGDLELQAYLQRLAGYALTGSTREHVLAFFWGPGGNGKGVFLNTLVRLLGSYAGVAAMDTFTASRFDRHPADLAALFGTRLVTAQETQEGRAWDEAKVKSITGGDPITARLMRQDFFTYTPQFKLLFAGNHKPRIANLDDAMRRRFHLVPFTVTPKVRNPDLADELRAEWPQILHWAIEGCLAWQRDGLAPPAAVLEATKAYFENEDILGRWIADCTEPGTDFVETRDLWANWQIWCMDKRERPGNERSFLQALEAHGAERVQHSRTRRHGIRGLVLRSPGGAVFPAVAGTLH